MTVSDRHEKRNVVTIHKTIHSIKITKGLIEGLVGIVEEGYYDIKEGRYSSVSYSIKEKDIETKYENPTDFLKIDLSSDTKQIIFHLHSSDKRIIVVITTSIYSNSEFRVEGNESTWVHGKSDMLSRLPAKSKTPNDFFHSPRRWIAYILAGMFFAFVTGVILSNDTLGRLINFLAWSILYPINFNYFFGWLYPKKQNFRGKSD